MTFELKQISAGDVAADYFDYCKTFDRNMLDLVAGLNVESAAFHAGVRAAEKRIAQQLADYNIARSYQGGV